MVSSNQYEIPFEGNPFVVRIPIEQAIKIFRANHWDHLPSGKTMRSHFPRIEMFFKGHFLDSISKDDISRLRRWMKEMGYSESNINKTHMILSRIYTFFAGVKEGKFLNGEDFSRIILPDKNPAALVKKVSEAPYARSQNKDSYIKEDVKTLLCSIADPDFSESIDGLYWTGLRQGDFFALTDKNIDLENQTISGIQHKSINNRYPPLPFKVFIPDNRMEMIKRRMAAVKPGTPIFSDMNLQKKWEKLRRLIGKPEIQLRDLRGSSTTYLIEQGVDLETARKRLGHTTLRTIQSYDKRPDETVAKATKKLTGA